MFPPDISFLQSLKRGYMPIKKESLGDAVGSEKGENITLLSLAFPLYNQRICSDIRFPPTSRSLLIVMLQKKKNICARWL